MFIKIILFKKIVFGCACVGVFADEHRYLQKAEASSSSGPEVTGG